VEIKPGEGGWRWDPSNREVVSGAAGTKPDKPESRTAEASIPTKKRPAKKRPAKKRPTKKSTTKRRPTKKSTTKKRPTRKSGAKKSQPKKRKK
jgi:hypothetical protein